MFSSLLFFDDSRYFCKLNCMLLVNVFFKSLKLNFNLFILKLFFYFKNYSLIFSKIIYLCILLKFFFFFFFLLIFFFFFFYFFFFSFFCASSNNALFFAYNSKFLHYLRLSLGSVFLNVSFFSNFLATTFIRNKFFLYTKFFDVFLIYNSFFNLISGVLNECFNNNSLNFFSNIFILYRKLGFTASLFIYNLRYYYLVLLESFYLKKLAKIFCNSTLFLNKSLLDLFVVDYPERLER